MSVNGKVAIVTGSSSGIGEAVARSLSCAGASVVINSSKSPVRGRAVADSLPRTMYVRADVADDRACRALVADTVEKFGQLDVLRRLAVPDDVAEAVMGLVRARFVTGQVLTVDGGMALR